jgi:hypothetical protein
MAFPTTLSSYVVGDTIVSSWANALETKIGIDGSAVATSLDYLVKSTSSTDPGHIHTTVNGLVVTATTKTLTISDSVTIATNSITLAGGEVITFTATNALTLGTTGATNVTLPTTGTLMANLAEDTTPQLGGELDMNSKNIAFNIEPGANETACGLIGTVTVDTNTNGIGSPLALAADGHYDDADADAIANCGAIVLALETGTGSKKVLFIGVMRHDAWNWTLGTGSANLIYISIVAGTLTQTAPSNTDDVIQPVGWALTDDCIFFNPSLVAVEHT